MPTISRFYGIIILMHLTDKEHNPPHIHAIYDKYEATFKISNGELFHGDFPSKGAKLVKEFIELHREELLDMWNGGEYKQLEGLD